MQDLINHARRDLRPKKLPLEPEFRKLQLQVIKAHKVLDGLRTLRTFNAQTREIVATQIARLELLAAATRVKKLPPTVVLNDPGLFFDLEDGWPDHPHVTTDDVDIESLIQKGRDRRVKSVLRKGRDRRRHIRKIQQWLAGAARGVRTPLRGRQKTQARKAWGRLVSTVLSRDQTMADILAKGKQRRMRTRVHAAMERQSRRYKQEPEASFEAESDEPSEEFKQLSQREKDSSLRRMALREREHIDFNAEVKESKDDDDDDMTERERHEFRKRLAARRQARQEVIESQNLEESEAESSEAEDPLRTDMLGLLREPTEKRTYPETRQALLQRALANRRRRFRFE